VLLVLSASTVLLALAVWLGATLVTLGLAAAIVLRLPPTYFVDDGAHGERGGAWRTPRGLVRNALGVVLVIVGLALSLPGIPGQGLLTVLIGLMLVDFPGRRRLEKSLARRPAVLAAANGIRARFDRPPLDPPRD
jgi:hypothetical protein